MIYLSNIFHVYYTIYYDIKHSRYNMLAIESIILDFESKTRLNFTNFKNFNFIIRNSSLKTSKTLMLLHFIFIKNFSLNNNFLIYHLLILYFCLLIT